MATAPFAYTSFSVSPDGISGMAIHPSKPIVALGTVQGIAFWDYLVGKQIDLKILQKGSIPAHLTFNRDGSRLVFRQDRATVGILTLEGMDLKTIPCAQVEQISVSTSDTFALSGRSIEVWDLDVLEKCWAYDAYTAGVEISLDTIQTDWPTAHVTSGAGMIAKSPARACYMQNGNRLVISGDLTQRVILLDAETYLPVGQIEPGPLLARASKATSNYCLVVGEAPHGGFLWDLSSGNRIMETYYQNLSPGPDCFAFHPDGNVLATGGKAGMLILDDLDQQKGLAFQTIGSNTEQLIHIDFNPEGDRLIIASKSGQLYLVELRVVTQ